jgi:hypothetical protein
MVSPKIAVAKTALTLLPAATGLILGGGMGLETGFCTVCWGITGVVGCGMGGLTTGLKTGGILGWGAWTAFRSFVFKMAVFEDICSFFGLIGIDGCLTIMGG